MRWLATAVLLLLLAGTLAGGLFLLARSSSPPPIEIILPGPSPAPEMKVYVSGAVLRPGVYTLEAGARLDDVVKAAGGATTEADLLRVNLALRVRDEDHLHIPRVGEPLVTPVSTAEASCGTAPLDLNCATAIQLAALPGIGPVTAKAIIDYRTKNGPFQRVEDLLGVPGIGTKTLDQIRGLVTVR